MILPAGLEIGCLKYLDFLTDFLEISQDEIVSCHESNTHWYFLRHFFWLKLKQKGDQLTIRPASADAVRAELFFHVIVHYAGINQFMCHST